MNLSSTFSRDFLASIVVFLVALPLCMGIAIASGVPPAAGLLTGMIGGIVAGALAGAPLQVSGPAAGLTVLVWQLVQTHGIGMLGAIVLVAGVAQLAAGALRLGQWFRAISPAVIQGMLAGIGVLIFASQFHIMIDDKPRGSGIVNLLSIPDALGKAFSVNEGLSHPYAAALGLATIISLVLWSTFQPARLKMVPGPLVAVVVATIAAAAFGMKVKYVTAPANLANSITLPTPDALLRVFANQELLLAALALAFIASAETLLCASAVDQMHSGPRANYDRELMAQGVGNLLCGAVGALPMTGVIVRSSANVEAGGQTRWSAILHGVWLLALVVALPGLLRLIPTAALAGILVYTGYKLVNPAKIRALARFGWTEVVIYFATMLGIVATDLLTGVAIGFALALAKLIYRATHLRVDVVHSGHRYDVYLEGAATFIGLPKLAKALESLAADMEAHIHIERLHHIDHACIDLIGQFQMQRAKVGSQVKVEMEQLRARYGPSEPNAAGFPVAQPEGAV
jgi:MFS superfamily sulfate permease-like transporter